MLVLVSINKCTQTSRFGAPQAGLDITAIVIIIIELTHSKTIMENTVEIEPQPVALDFKNLSQCSSRSK